MSKTEVISTQAEQLLKLTTERDEAVAKAIEAELKLKKAEGLKALWYRLAQQRLSNYITAKKDCARATKELTEWKNTYLPKGKWFKKLYDIIIFWDSLKSKTI